MIKHVDYIWNTTSFPTWDMYSMIDTGVFAQDDCEIRVAYQGAGIDVDRIVGFSQEGSAGDDDDFRIFYYNNGTFDWGDQRQSDIAGSIGGFIGIGATNLAKLTSAEGQTALTNARNKGWIIN